MNYYLLMNDDESHPNRWYLGGLKNFNNSILLDPPVEYMEPSKYIAELREPGESMDYTIAGPSNIPIVSQKLYDCLKGLPEVDKKYHYVEFHPVNIIDYKSDNNFYVMTIETKIDCVDLINSSGEEISGHKCVLEERSGQYRQVFEFAVCGDKINSDIFRSETGLGSIIVSQRVKDRLDEANVTGVILKKLVTT